jgi:hypothetical protein
MAAGHHVTKKILTALLVLTMLATAGCSGSKPKHPSSLASPAPPSGRTNPAAESGSAELVEEVQRELKATRVTRYQRTTSVDENNGSCLYDCSGLVDYAVGRVRPADLQPIPHTSARPLAGDIEGYLHRGLPGPIEGWRWRAARAAEWLVRVAESELTDPDHVPRSLTRSVQRLIAGLRR